MRMNNIELNVLVKGRSINEYPHMGQTFVEGRDGSAFEIEVRNHSDERIEAIISVDGRSVTDGKAAGPQSSGFLIEAHGSIRIPGFKINDRDAAAFTFTGPGKSYDEAMGGTGANRGVIGLLAFSEKPKPRPVRIMPQPYRSLVPRPDRPNWPNYPREPQIWYGSGSYYHSDLQGVQSIVDGAMAEQPITMSAKGMGSINLGAAAAAADRVMASNMTKTSFAMPTATCSVSDQSYSSPGVDIRVTDESFYSPVEQTLGTAFGERTEFQTTSVEFERGDMRVMMALYYDDARGLRKRGIALERVSKAKVKNHRPDAFPGMSTGCAIPPGWRG